MSKVMVRFLSAIGVGVFLLLGAATLSQPGFAQEAAPAATPATGGPIVVGSTSTDNPQPWTVNCTSQPTTGELVCNMTQALIAAETNQRLVAASVFRPQPSAAAVMRLSLPHGILLQEGADLSIDDGAPTKHPIIIADQNGSYADVELGANMLVALQGGDALKIGVATAAGERIEFQMSLKGFTAAFAKL